MISACSTTASDKPSALQLVGVFDIAFATFGEQSLHQFIDREFLFGVFFEKCLLSGRAFFDGFRQFDDERLASGKIVGNGQWLSHASNIAIQ
jgi:hypothetical protein